MRGWRFVSLFLLCIGLLFLGMHLLVAQGQQTLTVEIVAAYNNKQQMITHTQDQPVQVALMAIVTNADGERVPSQGMQWRIITSESSDARLIGVGDPDLTDDCGVSGRKILYWLSGPPGSIAIVTAEAVDSEGNVLGADSYFNTLIEETGCDQTLPGKRQDTYDLVKSDPCNVTYLNGSPHMSQQVEDGVSSWNNTSGTTGKKHIKLVPVNSHALLDIVEYCDSETTILGRTCTHETHQSNPEYCPEDIPSGKIVIYLNKYRMYGNCHDHQLPPAERCPYDWPPDDPANVTTIAHELGHALGLGHVSAKGNLMFTYDTNWYECGVGGPKGFDYGGVIVLYPNAN